MQDQLIDLLMYTVPALVTGVIAYFFFREHVKNENNRRHFLMHKDFKKEAIPMRLQAYERMTLFLERMVPSKLLIRVAPHSSDKNDYEKLLIDSIEQEFEHNLSQQIYLTGDCWSIIVAAKNTTIQLIRKANMSDKTDTANKLREVILTEMMEKQAPSSTALAYIKEEISTIW